MRKPTKTEMVAGSGLLVILFGVSLMWSTGLAIAGMFFCGVGIGCIIVSPFFETDADRASASYQEEEL